MKRGGDMFFCPTGESTLTDAMTAAGKTYEEIAQLVAEQVGSVVAAVHNTHTDYTAQAAVTVT